MPFTAEEEVVRFEGSNYSVMPEVLDFSIHEGIISRGTKVVHTVDYAEEGGEGRVLSNRLRRRDRGGVPSAPEEESLERVSGGMRSKKSPQRRVRRKEMSCSKLAILCSRSR